MLCRCSSCAGSCRHAALQPPASTAHAQQLPPRPVMLAQLHSKARSLHTRLQAALMLVECRGQELLHTVLLTGQAALSRGSMQPSSLPTRNRPAPSAVSLSECCPLLGLARPPRLHLHRQVLLPQLLVPGLNQRHVPCLDPCWDLKQKMCHARLQLYRHLLQQLPGLLLLQLQPPSLNQENGLSRAKLHCFRPIKPVTSLHT